MFVMWWIPSSFMSARLVRPVAVLVEVAPGVLLGLALGLAGRADPEQEVRHEDDAGAADEHEPCADLAASADREEDDPDDEEHDRQPVADRDEERGTRAHASTVA